MPKECSIDGCTNNSRTKGLCQMHYARLWRSGTVEDPAPSSQKTKHPLYITWMSAKRGGVLCDEWADDFQRFLSDVGESPDGPHRLYRIDVEKPYSKGNCRWRPISPGKKEDETRYEYQKRLQRERKQSPEKTRKYNLKSVYGLTVDQYNAILESQGGVCAICGGHETRIHGKTGKVKSLSVDHCHKTRKVRGILCSSCNIGLGKFNDDESVLMKAIEYKRKHQTD